MRTLLAALLAALPSTPGTRAPGGAQPQAPVARLAKVDLRSLPLSEACRLIADASGLNLVPSEEAGRREVSLYLRDVEPEAAVEALCRAHGLWFRRDAQAGLVRIGTPEEWRRDLTSLQAEQSEFFTLLYPNAIDVGYAIRNLFGDRVVLRANEADQELLRDLRERFSRFDLVDSRTQGFGLGGTFGNGSFLQGIYDQQLGLGLDSSSLPYSGAPAYQEPPSAPDQASRRLAPEDIERLEGALRGEGDVEAALAALARRDRAPIHVTVARRQNIVGVRTADREALEEIRGMVRKLDVPSALVLLEVRVLLVSLSDGTSSFFEYQGRDGDVAGEFTTGTIANAVPPALGVAGTGLRAGDLIFQFVDDTFAARMQVLQRENRVRSLSTPILLTANNEVSRLFVGREVPLNRGFSGGQVVSNESTTTSVTGSTAIEFRPVGTTLLITPNINADRTVTLRIVQETSNVDSTETVLIPEGDGFVQQEIPVVSSQTVSGTIVAKSDFAVAFGGMVESRTTKELAQVPLLGDLPLVGALFRREADVESRREVVVVVRPYVLSTPAEAEGTSARLFEALGTDPLSATAGAGDAPREVHGLDDEGPR
jgi:general secretion pathway protein D